MKNVLKVLVLFVVVLTMSSCTDNDDLKYNPNVESGWVQFLEDSDEVVGAFQDAQTKISLDVNIQVPTTSEDLTVFYDMQVVSGADPTTYFSNDGALVVPAGNTSHGGPDNGTGFDYVYLSSIDFDLDELAGVTLTEPMIFDVVLTSTSSNVITAGLTGVPDYPTSRRVIIAPSLDVFIGTYTVDEQFIAGVNAPSGLSDFFGESYEVILTKVAGDQTASKFTITNTAGVDPYFFDGTELTFSLEGGLSFDDGNSEDGYPVLAGFELLTVESSSYNYTSSVLVATGQLGTYGEYQFTLTKQ